MWKTLRINTKTDSIAVEDVKEEYKMLGGRSLIAQFMTDEVDPTCDPLGEKNKMMFCTAIFAGTTLSTAHRLSIGCKSPLTGGIKESNAGGTAAYYLAGHGYKAIILEDKPDNDEFKIVVIDTEGNARIESAEAYVGHSTYEVVDLAKEQFGDSISVITVGEAGEKEYRVAGIGVSEFGSGIPCRLAARGGVGAVMGSKGIKAILIEKPAKRYKAEVADSEAFDKAKVEFNKFLAGVAPSSPYGSVGTIANIAGTEPVGILPVKNFRGDFYPDVDKIGPKQFMANNAARGGKNGIACQPGCVVKCSNHYNDKDGKNLTSGLEYETVGLCGSNLLINDLDAIAEIDRFCDDFGVDTIEVGATLGVIMEAGKIEWGDVDGVMALLDEMKQGTPFGKIMGEGTESCGTSLGVKRIPTVKRQALAAYDPRNLKATGVTYALSPQGADHTAGVTFGTPYDGTRKYLQAYLSRTMQSMLTLADSCLCIFGMALGGLKRIDLMIDLFSAFYGEPYTKEKMVAIGVKNILQERAWNTAAGITIAEDKLPDFFYEEPSGATGAVFDYTEEELQCVYDSFL